MGNKVSTGQAGVSSDASPGEPTPATPLPACTAVMLDSNSTCEDKAAAAHAINEFLVLLSAYSPRRIECQTCSEVVAVLSTKDARVTQQAAAAVASLASSRDLANHIAAVPGAVEGLLELLSSSSSSSSSSLDVQEQAARALSNLAQLNSKACTQCLAAVDRISSGLQELLRSSSADAQEQAARLLTSLTCCDEFEGCAVQLQHVVPVLVAALRSSRTEVQLQATRALIHCVCRSCPWPREFQVAAFVANQDGILSGLSGCLSSSSTEVQCAALEVLAELTKQDDRLPQIAEFAAPGLVELLSSSSLAVRSLAAMVLSCLANEDSTAARIANVPGAVEGLMALLTSGGLLVECVAVATLERLVRDDSTSGTAARTRSAAQQIAQVPGVLSGLASQLTKRRLLAHGLQDQAERIVQIEARVLGTLAGSAATATRIIEETNAVAGLMGWLDHTGTQEAAAAALKQLVLEAVSSRAKIAREPGLFVVLHQVLGSPKTIAAAKAHISVILRELSQQAGRSYTEADLRSATEEFAHRLGAGGLGTVYRGTLQGTPVAVKRLHRDLLGPSTRAVQAAFTQEVTALSQLRHPHMVVLLGACHEGYMLVYELMEGGSLEEALFDAARPPLLWQDRLRIAHEVASALEYMHSAQPPLVHLNVKPANILLTPQMLAKLGDAGMARLLPDTGATTHTGHIAGGTPGYVDPSYVAHGTYGPKSDVYSLGVVLLQLLVAKPVQEAKALLLGRDGERMSQNGSSEVLANLDPRAGAWPAAVASQLADLAADCIDISRRRRPDLATVVRPRLQQLAEEAAQVAPGAAPSVTVPEEPPAEYLCPISRDLMEDPVVVADGHSYDRRSIEAWFNRGRRTSPLTNAELPNTTLVPNHALRGAIHAWREAHSGGEE